LRPVGLTVVAEGLATVVATAVVLGVCAAGLDGVPARRTLVVVVVFAAVAVDVTGVDGVVVDVVGSVDVVVPTRAVDVVEATAFESRMAGSLLRCGTPAMATPTAAHATSMSTVIERCPGLTVGPPQERTLGVRVTRVADPVS
jgi:hypothetical protein